MIDIKEIIIKEYKNEYWSLVEDLIEDEFVKADIMRCIEEFKECAIVAFEENILLGVGVFTGIDKKTSFTLYVTSSRRQEGIGNRLLVALEEKMEELGVEEAVCDYQKNEREQHFIYNRGYSHLITSNYMIYSGMKLKVEGYDIIPYEDKYYEESQRVMTSSFHRMRVSLGLKSEESLPSEEDRQLYKSKAKKIWLIRNEEAIVGVSILGDNEIDAVAVDIKERGKGYGKALVSYSINELLRTGTRVSLWVVEGNLAKLLYKKLGFKAERIHEFVIKNIKEN